MQKETEGILRLGKQRKINFVLDVGDTFTFQGNTYKITALSLTSTDEDGNETYGATISKVN